MRQHEVKERIDHPESGRGTDGYFKQRTTKLAANEGRTAIQRERINAAKSQRGAQFDPNYNETESCRARGAGSDDRPSRPHDSEELWTVQVRQGHLYRPLQRGCAEGGATARSIGLHGYARPQAGRI